MADNEPTHEPHRPNYAELKNEHAEAQQREQQQQEAAPEPTRPDRLRAPAWTDRGDMASQQQSAAEHVTWKQLAKDPELAQKMQEQKEQQHAAQRENEGPQHDNPGGRER